MANERLHIEVSESGTRTVKRNLQEIGAGAKTSEGPVSQLRRAIEQLTSSVSRIESTLDRLNATLLTTRGAAVEVAAATSGASASTSQMAAAAAEAATAEAALSRTLNASAAAAVAAAAGGDAVAASNALVASSAGAAATAEAALAAVGATASASQEALGGALAALPKQAGNAARGIGDLSSAIALLSSAGGGSGRGGGGGVFGSLGASLNGFGGSARNIASTLGGAFRTAFGAAVTAARGLLGALGSVTAALFTMRGAIAAIVTAVVLRQFVELADTYTIINNRLKLVTEGTTNLRSVYAELLDVSQRTRSSFEANVELFNRVALATKDLGTSQREVLQFTESLNQAIKLSGATSIEASNALIQLSQGLASGALRGDELRSVMEQLPAVADVIAKGLGVTRGELRKLGQEGKITAEVILDAFRKARQELAEKFAKGIPTIAEGFVVLKNQLVDTVGQITTAAGASQGLGTAFKFIVKGLEEATPAVIAFIHALDGTITEAEKLSPGMKLLASTVVILYEALKTIAQVLVTLVVGAFNNAGRAIGAIAVSVAAFARGIVESFKAVGSVVADVGIALGQAAKGNFKEAGETLVAAFTDPFKDAKAEFSFAGAALSEALADTNESIKNGIADISGDVVENAQSTVDKLTKIWSEGAREIGAVQITQRVIGNTQGPNRVPAAGLSEQELRRLERERRELDSLVSSIDKVRGAQLELADAARVFQREVAKGTITAAEATRLMEIMGAQLRDQLDPFGKMLEDLDREAELLGKSNIEREIAIQLREAEQQLLQDGQQLSQSQRELLEADIRRNQLLAREADLLQRLHGGREEAQRDLAALNSLFQQGKISSAEYASALNDIEHAMSELDQSATGGVRRALLDLIKVSQQFGDELERTLVGTFDRAVDVLTDFVTKGKADFKGFVDSVIADLARLFIKNELSQLIGAAAGGTGGVDGSSFLGSLLGALGGAAEGDMDVRRGEAMWIGEKGQKELFVPKTDGAIIPASKLGGGQTVVQQTVHFHVSAPNGYISKQDQVESARRLKQVTDNAGRRNG